MVDSSIEIATLSFRIVDSSIDQTRIASFASHSQDQRGIGRSILHRKKRLSTLLDTVHRTSSLGVCTHQWLKQRSASETERARAHDD